MNQLRTTKSPVAKMDFRDYLSYDEGPEGDLAEQHTNVLIGGEMGSGKTRFAFTAPGAGIKGEHLTINFDLGLKTARSMGFIPWKWVLTEDDSSHYAKTLKLVQAIYAKEEPFANLKTVVLDAYTGGSQLFMNDMLRKLGREPTGSGQKAEYDQWAALRNQLRKITNLLKAAPVNFIAIAHTDYREDSNGRLIPAYDVDGSFRKDLPKLFDEVYYMEAVSVGQGTEYRTWIKPHPKGWPTKSRTFLEQDWLPGKKAYVLNATWDLLFGELWKSALEKQKGAGGK